MKSMSWFRSLLPTDGGGLLAGVCAIVAGLALSGCSGSEAATSDAPTSSPEPSRQASSAHSDSGSGAGRPSGHSTSPVVDELEWRQVKGVVEDTVTVAGPWVLRIDPARSRAVLSGPEPKTVSAGPGFRISQAELNERYALVVSENERQRRPGRATVIDLSSGEVFDLDGTSEVPPAVGGTWALEDTKVWFATYSSGRYCLASAELDGQTTAMSWCAPPRTGFTNARIGNEFSLLTFDAGRPSCRTLVTVGTSAPAPYPGVATCQGWEGVVLSGGWRVWSSIPDEKRVSEAQVFASRDGRVVNLGTADSGSLVSCGDEDAAYFGRSPQRSGEPAQILRWDGRLTVVYESPGDGEALVEPPRCGGDTLTVSALSESGDEQVWAEVG
jgi:hypothetical protein